MSTEQGDGLGLLCPCFLLFLILNRAALNGASTFLWGLSHLRTNPRQTGHQKPHFSLTSMAIPSVVGGYSHPGCRQRSQQRNWLLFLHHEAAQHNLATCCSLKRGGSERNSKSRSRWAEVHSGTAANGAGEAENANSPWFCPTSPFTFLFTQTPGAAAHGGTNQHCPRWVRVAMHRSLGFASQRAQINSTQLA